MNTHTPGPWTAHAPDSAWDEWHIVAEDAVGAIARTHGDPNGNDARLIASAPELLAALVECEAILTQLGADGDLGDMPAPCVDNARAAILKAKGK